MSKVNNVVIPALDATEPYTDTEIAILKCQGITLILVTDDNINHMHEYCVVGPAEDLIVWLRDDYKMDEDEALSMYPQLKTQV